MNVALFEHLAIVHREAPTATPERAERVRAICRSSARRMVEGADLAPAQIRELWELWRGLQQPEAV